MNKKQFITLRDGSYLNLLGWVLFKTIPGLMFLGCWIFVFGIEIGRLM